MPQATDPTVVAAAAYATHEILNHVGDAIGRLNHAFEGHVVDAHGVLSDIGQSFPGPLTICLLGYSRRAARRCARPGGGLVLPLILSAPVS